MRAFLSLGLGIALVLLGAVAGGQAPVENPPAVQPRVESPDLAAIRQTSLEFEAAFNRGDAAAIAQQWTEDGDLIDEIGQVFTGRKAIEQEYEAVFAANKGQRIKIIIDTLRLLNDSAAIEDGRATLESDVMGTSIGQYTAVHVKVDGKWLMSTVRETHVESPSAYDSVSDLGWLIGTWVAEEQGSKTEAVCRWVANKSFIERNYSVTHPDRSTTSGLQLIGFNPQGGHLQSWNFSSDGGHAIGVWTRHENGWAVESQGILADGQSTTAINTLGRLGDDAYVWQSTQRTISGGALPNTEEVILRRKIE